MRCIIYFSCLFIREVQTLPRASSALSQCQSPAQPGVGCGAVEMKARSVGLLLLLSAASVFTALFLDLPTRSLPSSSVSSHGDRRAKFIKIKFCGLSQKINSICICCLSLPMLSAFYHLVLPLPAGASFPVGSSCMLKLAWFAL